MRGLAVAIWRGVRSNQSAPCAPHLVSVKIPDPLGINRVFILSDIPPSHLGIRLRTWHSTCETVFVADVIQNSERSSRHYLEQLQATLKKDGDDRLARALADYDILKFSLGWITSIASAILITLFVRSVYLGNGLDCFIIMLTGVGIRFIYQECDRRLFRHYSRRFYEAIPEDLRWCFRQKP